MVGCISKTKIQSGVTNPLTREIVENANNIYYIQYGTGVYGMLLYNGSSTVSFLSCARSVWFSLFSEAFSGTSVNLLKPGTWHLP